MKLQSWLMLISSVFVVSAAPVEKSGLTGPPTLRNDDFDSTVSNGTWWVKFFSPYCPHCTEFAPIWNELWHDIRVDAAKEGFYMANVDCVEDGDLCDRKNIEAYPNVQIFEKGKVVHEYGAADRNLEPMKKFYQDWVKGIRPTPTTSSGVVQKTSTPVPKFVAPTPLSTLPTPNPNGESVDLTHQIFDKVVRGDERGWLVKFHSPRCPHCLELKPAWTEVAKRLENTLNVGEINCDRAVALCKELKIDKIPAIKFFAGDAECEYKGLRTLADLLAFGENAAESNEIKDIDMEKLDDAVQATNAGGYSTGRVTVNFVYFYDDATVYEDFDALRRMATSVIGNARVFKTQDKRLVDRMKVTQFPSLYAVTDENRWVEYPHRTPKEIRNNKEMVKWAKKTWLSQVPQLSPANAKEILENAQYVVIGVIDPREIEEHENAIREMKQTALTLMENNAKADADDIDRQRQKKQLKLDEAVAKGDNDALEKAKKIKVSSKKKPSVGFAWIDNVFWERWVKGRYGADGAVRRAKPRAIINNEGGSRYWDVNAHDSYIDVVQSQLLDSLETIFDKSDNSMRPKALHNSIAGYFVHVRVFFKQFWHWIAIFALCFLVLKMRRSKRKDTNGTYQAPPLQIGKLD